MFGFCDHFIHEVVITPKNQIVLIDVADTPDCGWEGAYAIFDEEAFRDWWLNCNEGEGVPYTIDDVIEYGEEANAFYGCGAMDQIILSEKILSIGGDAFTNCSAKLMVRKGSFAEQYAKANKIAFRRE